VLGLEAAAGGDKVFRHLVRARIIEPVSKLDSLRVLEEAGVTAASYRTLKRRLPARHQDHGLSRRDLNTTGWPAEAFGHSMRQRLRILRADTCRLGKRTSAQAR
jgi:hypothetical protein